jgi:hypothetical protein
MAIVRARLGAYARWQLRDFILGPGGITIGIVLLQIWITSRTQVIESGVGPPRTPSLDWLVQLVGLLGSIYATSSLVSEDRARGYYRFLFAKPVGPVRYYAQAFALRGVVLLVLAALVSLLGAWIAHPVPLLGAVAYTAVMYVFAGGVTACQSTLWRFAWVGSLVLYLASIPVAQLAAPDAPIGPVAHALWRAAHVILPPFSQQTFLHGMLASAPPWGDIAGSIAWCVGYGLIALVAGAFVIRGLEWAR